jgi:hypothetical protein
MITNVSNGDPTSKLQRLLKKQAALNPELAKYQQTAKSLDDEEKKLLETLDFTDEKAFKKISDVRLKKELAPRKIESLRSQQEDVRAEIRSECYQLISLMREKLANLQMDGMHRIQLAILPFFDADGRSVSMEEAGAVFKSTFYGKQSNHLLGLFGTEGFATVNPEHKARQLLGYYSEVEKLFASFSARFPKTAK